MLKIFGIVLLGLALSGCEYDGNFRYPCQDPVNWQKDECKPPICTANGACPEDLVKIEDIGGTKND